MPKTGAKSGSKTSCQKKKVVTISLSNIETSFRKESIILLLIFLYIFIFIFLLKSFLHMDIWSSQLKTNVSSFK